MAQAKLIETLDKFLDVLDKSKLFSSEQVQKLRKDLAGSDKPPLDIARMLVKNNKLSKWQAGQLLSGYFKFRQGQFVLRDQLGKGRLGALFLAQDEKRKQLVALRSLSKAATTNADAVARFVSAAQSAIALEHENVARVLEVNSDSERHLLVTEYVSGRDLQQRVEQEGPLPAAQALSYLRQAASALALAHKQQVIHGSLHPGCLLVDANGLVKIADWGLAPIRGCLKGYSSPQQSSGQPADASTDVFLLGSTLYFLLSGRAPFAGGTPEEVPALKKSGRPLSLNKLRQDLPGPLVDLCDQLMAADPARRPSSMQDVLTQISQIGAAVSQIGVQTGAVGGEDRDHNNDDDDVVELEVDELVELDDDSVSDEPVASVSTEPSAGDADQPATADTAPMISLGEANKTARISDTAAIAISTGKESAAGPVGAFKISMKKKKTKSKGAAQEKPTASPGETDAGTVAAPAAASELVTSAKSSGPPSRKVSQQHKAKAEERAITSDSGTTDALEPAEDAAAAKKKKKKKSGVPLGLIIGLAALFGFTLLGGGALLIFLMFRGGGEVVAQADGGASGSAEAKVDPEASDPEIDPEDAPDEIVLVQDDPGSAKTADAASDPGDAAADAATSGAESPTPDAPATGTASGEATPTTGAPPAVGTEAPVPGSAEPKPAGSEPPAAAPAETDTKKPADDDTKKKADDDAAAKKQAEQEAAAKKQADEKKKADEEKKKAASAAPVFVFAPSIDLPALPTADAAGGPLPLGKINILPTDVCFISMTGGENAARGHAEFMIRNAQSGTAPRDWEFVVKEDSTETVIATLGLPDKDLLFQWLPAAADNPNAGNLRNCSLKMTAGTAKPQQIALRSPISDESVPIDLTKPSIQARWDMDAAPDPGTLQVAASMKGHKIVLDPPQPIGAAKGAQWIYLGENKDASVLALKLETAVSARGVQITLKPYLTISGEKPLAYNKATKKKVMQQLSQRPQLQNQVTFYQEQLKKAPAPQKQQVQIALTQAEQGLAVFDKMAQQLSQLDQLEQSYNGAVLDFQVIYRTLQGETVLVQTQAGGGAP